MTTTKSIHAYLLSTTSGSVTNYLAAVMGSDLQGAAPFYGRAPKSEDVKNIRERCSALRRSDPRVIATRAGNESALKAANAQFEMHSYTDTKHGFHNNSTPRYSEAAAKLAWQRTIELFKTVRTQAWHCR